MKFKFVGLDQNLHAPGGNNKEGRAKTVVNGSSLTAY
jgi:hypothetical protein